MEELVLPLLLKGLQHHSASDGVGERELPLVTTGLSSVDGFWRMQEEEDSSFFRELASRKLTTLQ